MNQPQTARRRRNILGVEVGNFGSSNTTIGNRNDHQRRHFEEKPYHCGECGIKYYRKYQLVKHVESRHNGRANIVTRVPPTMLYKKPTAVAGSLRRAVEQLQLSDLPSSSSSASSS